MSWNFILLIFINVCQVRWIVIVFPINYVQEKAPDGNFQECPGIIKMRCTQGLARTRIVLRQRPGADTEENRTLWFSVERFV